MATKISGYAAWRFLARVKKGGWAPAPGELFVLDLGRKATVDDLRWVDGKAEIVDDNLVVIAPSSGMNGGARTAILVSLKRYQRTGRVAGVVFGSTVAFLAHSPHRCSFCPDIAWYTGPRPCAGADFPAQAPVFAVEVLDTADYGEPEEYWATKRADYFAAGTQVVWDVDVLREELIRVYRASDPENPTVYRRGEIAEAEPAVPGWRFPVDELWD
jgi:Uma2 family endonuclease